MNGDLVVVVVIASELTMRSQNDGNWILAYFRLISDVRFEAMTFSSCMLIVGDVMLND